MRAVTLMLAHPGSVLSATWLCVNTKINEYIYSALCFTAKFNCTEPGTLYNFIEGYNITTTAVMPTEKMTTSVVPSLHTTTSKPDNNIDQPMIRSTDLDFIYVLL